MSKTKTSKKTDKNSNNAKDDVNPQCLFVALKGDKEKCTESSTTPYGFCKKHVTTVQAKKAKEVYDESHKEDIKPNEEKSIDTKGKKVITKTEEPKIAKEKTPQKSKLNKKEEIAKPKTSKGDGKKDDKKETKDVAKEPKGKSKNTKEIVKGEQKPTTRTKKIFKNRWERFEDPDTHIVFDGKTHEAYGVQDPSGRVTALKQEHQDICIRNGWDFNVPYGDDDEDDNDESLHDSDFDEDEEEGDSDEEEEDDSDEEEEDDSDEEEEDDSDEEEEDDSDEEEEDDSDEEEEYDSDLVDSDDSESS